MWPCSCWGRCCWGRPPAPKSGLVLVGGVLSGLCRESRPGLRSGKSGLVGAVLWFCWDSKLGLNIGGKSGLAGIMPELCWASKPGLNLGKSGLELRVPEFCWESRPGLNFGNSGLVRMELWRLSVASAEWVSEKCCDSRPGRNFRKSGLKSVVSTSDLKLFIWLYGELWLAREVSAEMSGVSAWIWKRWKGGLAIVPRGEIRLLPSSLSWSSLDAHLAAASCIISNGVFLYTGRGGVQRSYSPGLSILDPIEW